MKSKKLFIDILTYVFSGLTSLFMCLFLILRIEWFFYAEIVCVFPFWVLIGVQLVIWLNAKNGVKKDEN